MSRLDTTDEDFLTTLNVFGNYRRYTGYQGGYYDHSDSTYRDVDGNLSTENDEFNEVGFGYYIIDHYTGLGWRKARGGSHSWLNGMAYVYNLVLDGRSDWFAPSKNVLDSIINDTYLNPLGRLPFDIQLSQLTSTVVTNNPTAKYYQATTGGIFYFSQSSGSSSATSFVRAHFT